MSEKSKKILENLKAITQKENNDPVVPIASNMDNDRIYGGFNDAIHLINRDGSRYHGKIFKRRITQQGIDGANFFSHCFETADGRWFDRAGLPCAKPSTLVKQSDNEVDEESK